MCRSLIALSLLVALAVLPAAARGDWDPDDPAKWVQMPNPNGWDVDVTGRFLADDFECTEPGPVTDIHFWGSWKGGSKGTISNVRVEFWRNDPGTAQGFSQPSTPIWGDDFGPDVVTERFWGEGEQGWYDPVSGDYTPKELWPDHTEIYQYNIDMSGIPLDQLFYQEGTAGAPAVYWLLLKVDLVDEEHYAFGWKTAIGVWNDSAVYDMTPAEWPPTWQPLTDPIPATVVIPLDLAFVVNAIPEPGVFVLTGLGLLALRRSRRAKR